MLRRKPRARDSPSLRSHEEALAPGQNTSGQILYDAFAKVVPAFTIAIQRLFNLPAVEWAEQTRGALGCCRSTQHWEFLP